MITQYNITAAAWSAITSAGQSGTIWLDEDNDGAAGDLDIRIYESDSGEPETSKATEGKRLYKSNGNKDVLEFTADNENSIFYAICKNPGTTATISVDAL